MQREVWVIAEFNNHQLAAVTAELLSECRKVAKELNCQLCTCLLGYKVEEHIDSLRNYGTEKVYLVDNKALSAYSLDAYGFVLEKLIDKYDPMLVAIGATPLGIELAPRIAARLRLPCITEVKRLNATGDNFNIAKSGFSDRVYLNFDFIPKKPLIITILPGDMDADITSDLAKMEIIREVIRFQSNIIRTRNVGFIKGDPKKIRLQQAELIVAGGKGVDAEGFSYLEELGDILGASIGGTRPLVDDTVISFERQIGITGQSVAPKLLIAFGISGAREFTMGIANAKIKIAVNTDPKAPIFNITDLGVVGDVNKIAPAIIRALKEKRKSG
jgi:electron transfer flavoprotein alpha subunit